MNRTDIETLQKCSITSWHFQTKLPLKWADRLVDLPPPVARSTQENLDHFIGISDGHLDEYIDESGKANINGHAVQNQKETPERLRKMRISLVNFTFMTYLKTPKKYSGSLGAAQAASSDLYGVALIPSVDWEMQFDMPEKINDSGAMNGKLAPMVIGLHFPEATIALSYRQYCFILELLSRNLSEDFIVVQPLASYRPPPVIDGAAKWLECPITFRSLALELSDFRPSGETLDEYTEVCLTKLVLKDAKLNYASTNIGSMLVDINAATLLAYDLGESRQNFAEQYLCVLKGATEGGKGWSIKYHAIVLEADLGEEKLKCDSVIDLQFNGLDLVVSPGLLDFINYWTAEDPMDWDGPYPPWPEPIEYQNTMLLLLEDTKICAVIGDVMENPNDTPICVSLQIDVDLQTTDIDMDLKLNIFNLRGYRSSPKFSETSQSNDDLIQPFQTHVRLIQKEKVKGVNSKRCSRTITMTASEPLNIVLLEKNYVTLMNVSVLLGGGEEVESEDDGTAEQISTEQIEDKPELTSKELYGFADNVYVEIPAIYITIVKDIEYYLPLLQLSLWRLTALYQTDSLQLGGKSLHNYMKSEILISVAIDFFNQSLSLWEPLVELWPVKASIKQLDKQDANNLSMAAPIEQWKSKTFGDNEEESNGISIMVSTEQRLDINVTPVCLIAINRTVSVLSVGDECQGSVRSSSVGSSFVSHEVKNSLGLDTVVWEESIDLCPEMATRNAEKVKREHEFCLKCIKRPWLNVANNKVVHVATGGRGPVWC